MECKTRGGGKRPGTLLAALHWGFSVVWRVGVPSTMESLGVCLCAGAFRFLASASAWRAPAARRTLPRIVEIERTRRGTAYRNMLKRYSAKAVLEREQERLIEEWSRCLRPSYW
jgi:hypothetical protein